MNDNKICILDYRSSNSYSLKSALDKISIKYKISNNFDDISDCKKVIIPGIGNMKNLFLDVDREDLKKRIENYINENEGFIYGICLGMQAFLTSSSEGDVPTLQIIKGKTVALKIEFKKNLNVGFYSVSFDVKKSVFKRLFKDMINPKLYFLHKYHCKIDETDIDAMYIKQDNKDILAGMYKKNILGTQFHPELSGKNGLIFLKNFCNFTSD